MKSKKSGGFSDRGVVSQALHLPGDLIENDAKGLSCQIEETSNFSRSNKVIDDQKQKCPTPRMNFLLQVLHPLFLLLVSDWGTDLK